MPITDRDELLKALRDSYAQHKHSSFHEDQMLAQVGDTLDEDRPLPRWIKEATMDDEEWADMKAQQMVQNQIANQRGDGQ